MDFSKTTLVAFGDSFVYGQYEDDLNYQSCWNRSWVSKLEKLGRFKSSINLAAPGASNSRSFRMLLKFLDEIYSPEENYLIIYAITDLSRFEVCLSADDFSYFKFVDIVHSPYDTAANDTKIAPIGPWIFNNPKSCCDDARVIDSLKMYYGFLTNKNYHEKMFAQQLLAINNLMAANGLKHHYMTTLDSNFFLKQFSKYKIELPIIQHRHGRHLTITDFLSESGFKPGSCGHFDHDGNQFLAENIYSQIKGQS